MSYGIRGSVVELVHQNFIDILPHPSELDDISERLVFLVVEIFHAARPHEDNVLLVRGTVSHAEHQTLKGKFVLSMNTIVERTETTPSTTGGLWKF